jgi:hypothetical protein
VRVISEQNIFRALAMCFGPKKKIKALFKAIRYNYQNYDFVLEYQTG